MALIPENDYAGQIATGDAGYPHGKARNVTVSGDGTGTPLEAAWVNDVWGFFQNLLTEGGVTPSGNPDEVGASQYLDALIKIFPVRWAGQVFTTTTPTVASAWGPAPTPSYNSLSVRLVWPTDLVANTTNTLDLVAISQLGFDVTASFLNTTTVQISTWNSAGEQQNLSTPGFEPTINLLVLGTSP